MGSGDDGLDEKDGLDEIEKDGLDMNGLSR